MQVRVAVIADAANVSPPGKLNVMGVFDTVTCRTFPALHPMMVLVLRIQTDFEDADQKHQLVVTLRDEDMKIFAKAESEALLPRIPAGRTGAAHQIMQFAGMTFHRPGTYRFHVEWDGREIAQVPLHVLQMTPSA